MRRGELWESTAIPEIRMQADALARDVLAALSGAEIRHRSRDPYCLPAAAGNSR